MKSILRIGFCVFAAYHLYAADAGPKDKLSDGIKQLAAKPNYSWTTTTKEADGSGGRLGPIEGKMEKEGLLFLSFSPGGLPVEVYMKGQKGSAKALEGWQSFDEIAQAGGTAEAIVKYLRAYKAPAAQSAELTRNVKDLKEVDGALGGDLTEEAVNEMLLLGARRREGQDPPKASDPKGTIKFWVKEGSMTKYEMHIQGKVTSGERVSDIDRTITVEIKDPGTTKIEIPDEAKQKLS